MQNIRSKYWARILGIIIILLCLAGCQSVGGVKLSTPAPNNASQAQPEQSVDGDNSAAETVVQEGQRYSTREEVAAYLNQFHKLPPNYLTKAQAQQLGWDNAEGNLWEVTDQMSIGGDRFGNREGLLPTAQGRRYYECDINYSGGYRGAQRIVYSNDGLIYYSDDHYKTFSQLY